jgi:hypothetical protein
MAGPRDDRTKGKPPPGLDAETAPLGLDAETAPLGQRRRSKITRSETASVPAVVRGRQPRSDELLPRRAGHDPTDCTTCQRAEALVASRRLRELQALRDGRRVIDLRDTP